MSAALSNVDTSLELMQQLNPNNPATATEVKHDRRVQYAWLALGLVKRDLNDRYAGTAWGLAWAVIQPLLMLGLYAFIFSWVFKIRLPGSGSSHDYVIFVALGIWPWFMIQDALLRSLGALRNQATLIRKTTMSRDLPVMVACASTLALHGGGYLLVIFLLKFSGASISLAGLPLFLITAASLSFMIFTAGLFVSALQLVWRDLEQAMQPVLTVMFYATPILYPVTMVPEAMRAVIAASPVAWIVDRLRGALLDGLQISISDGALFAGTICGLWVTRSVYMRIVRQAEDLL